MLIRMSAITSVAALAAGLLLSMPPAWYPQFADNPKPYPKVMIGFWLTSGRAQRRRCTSTFELLVTLPTRFNLWAPRKIGATHPTPQNCRQMIPLRSRSDSLTFTPGPHAIDIESNFSRCPYVLRLSGTLPPVSASFVMTCLCSHTFISAEPSRAPV